MAYMNQFSVSNGAADVTILSSPASSVTRTVQAGGLNIMNLDTAEITVTIQANNNGTNIVQDIVIIPAGESWSNDKQVMCLDADNQTLEIYLGGAVAATEADVSCVYRDESQ